MATKASSSPLRVGELVRALYPNESWGTGHVTAIDTDKALKPYTVTRVFEDVVGHFHADQLVRVINGCDVIHEVAGAKIIDHRAGYMVYRSARVGTYKTLKGAISAAVRTAAPPEATVFLTHDLTPVGIMTLSEAVACVRRSTDPTLLDIEVLSK